MKIQPHQKLLDIYLLNPELEPQQLFDAINACLFKAEALAAIASTIDFEAYTSEIVSNYLWMLSDIIHETKCLWNKMREIS